MLMAVYDLMRWGRPAPIARRRGFYFLTSHEAKERLKPHLERRQPRKDQAAPATAIIGYDLDFPETLAAAVSATIQDEELVRRQGE